VTARIYSLHLWLSNAYLVEGPDGAALIDAGMPGEAQRILRAIERCCTSRLRWIIITHAHADHYGSAAALRQATGAMIAVHRLDGPTMAEGGSPLGEVRGPRRLWAPLLRALIRRLSLDPTPADWLLEDGDSLPGLGFSARIIHAPGHTTGSACLMIDEQIAFVGDLLTTNGRARLQRYYAVDWDALHASLQHLKGMGARLLYPGHGPRPLDREALAALEIP